MNLGIIGLPQVGKKTIFNLLTGVAADKAPKRSNIAYAVAPVKDPRVDRLSAMYQPKKTKYAEFEIALPPDVQPDTAREADWLPPLRTAEGLVHVVRAFESANVFHVKGNVDPARDLDLVDAELLFADLALADKRLIRIERETTKRTQLTDREKAVLERCKAHLENGHALRSLDLAADDLKLVASLQFLTLKPLIMVINGGEDVAAAERQWQDLAARMRAQQAVVVFLSAAIEAEIKELPADERDAFMKDLGLAEPAAHRLSRSIYESLGLISFFTVGPDEVRAWPLRRGSTAVQAAGKIHSDLERGFIRADTIAYDDLLRAGSEKAARAANLYHLHGKEYPVADGDIIEIRFSV